MAVRLSQSVTTWVGVLLLAVTAYVNAAEKADGGKAELPAASKKKIDFDRDIKPIFTAHCLDCHGAKKPKSGLRVDQKSSLLRGGESGEPSILPGKSGESYLIKVVAGLDADLLMPPKGKGKRLSPGQVGLLRAWIDQGLVWPGQSNDDNPGELKTDHWSFAPVQKTAPPKFDDPWAAGAVDAFIFARLKQAGLTPSPSADRVTLIRRLYLDMHGLFPTPKQVRDFVEDTRPDAYAQLVERVLDSPRYGERWAQHWLDVVRYADTHGFETNFERPNAYRYRDYVIQSLNEDKPYDRFVFEQLAGDSVGSGEATGFLVAGAWDKVKSPDINLTLMQRQDELADMINTTSTAFLGLTVACARCHHHKFDPILQTDYYALQAVFAGVQHGDRNIKFADTEQRQRQAKSLGQEVAQVRKQLALIAAAQRKAAGKTERRKLAAINARSNTEPIKPVMARFVRFNVTATNNGIEPCIDELEVWSPASDGAKAGNVALTPGTRLASSGNYKGNPKHKLEHINDGQYGNGRSWISSEHGKGWVQLEFPKPFLIDRIVWGRDRQLKYKDRTPVRYTIEVSMKADQWQTVARWEDHLPLGSSQDLASVFDFKAMSADEAARAKALIANVKQLETRRAALTAVPKAYAGNFVKPGPTHRLYRGDPMAKREQVAPESLTVLHRRLGKLNLPADAPEQKRRVALANWMINPDHPLTARVMVNRIWQQHFGRGIVATPSDFGRMGVKPTHPKLLDFLARQLIENGWSIKHIHRLILHSKTYQQAGLPDERALAVDRDAQWLWRFPPRRLEAEAIRDNILYVSGVLDLTMGGPGFRFFKPNANYVRVYEPKDSYGAAEYRRMVYALRVRMEKDDVFGAFDCPDAGQPTANRSRSTTPVQSLGLFNSGFVLQQADLFARRIVKQAPDDVGEQVNVAFELALSRKPDESEQHACRKLVKDHGLAALCRVIFNMNEFLFIP